MLTDEGNLQSGTSGFTRDADAKGYSVTCMMPDSDMADAGFGLTRWDVPVVRLRNMAETRAFLHSDAPDEQKAVIREAIHHAAECCYHTHRGKIAARYLRALADCAPDLADKAKQLRNLGMLCEGLGEFAEAVTVYSEALLLEPIDHDEWYWLHNNIGYSLVQLGRHAEAERHCRMAIDIDSARFNAHKNLGLAVAGQGRYLEAARCLAEAVKLAPGVPRAFEALAEMVATHPEVLDQDAEWAQCWDQIRKDRESGNRRT